MPLMLTCTYLLVHQHQTATLTDNGNINVLTITSLDVRAGRGGKQSHDYRNMHVHKAQLSSITMMYIHHFSCLAISTCACTLHVHVDTYIYMYTCTKMYIARFISARVLLKRGCTSKLMLNFGGCNLINNMVKISYSSNGGIPSSCERSQMHT